MDRGAVHRGASLDPRLAEQDHGRNFQFFGLEVELWQIGDSPAAPKFNVVSKPNDWSQSVAQAAPRDRRRGTVGNADHAASVLGRVERGAQCRGRPGLRQQEAAAAVWMSYPLGRSGCLGCSDELPKKQIGPSIYLSGAKAKAFFGLLKRQKEEIEKTRLSPRWQELPAAQDSRIATYLTTLTQRTKPTGRASTSG